MPSIDTRLRRSYASVADRDCWVLALVPFVTALLQVDKVLEVLTHRGVSVGITLGLPLPISSIWKFVSVPARSGTVSGPDTALGVLVVGLGLVVQGVLTAGYLGSLRNALAGADWRFLASVRRYFVSFLGFGLLLIALFIPPLVVALVGGPLTVLLFVWLPLLFVVGYLVYAAPYLVVLEDEPLGSALTRSVSLATGEVAFLRYAVGYALLVAAISLPATVVTVNAGFFGVLLGAVALAPVSLVFDAMTLQFVADVVGTDEHLAGPDAGGDSVETDPESPDQSPVRDDGSDER